MKVKFAIAVAAAAMIVSFGCKSTGGSSVKAGADEGDTGAAVDAPEGDHGGIITSGGKDGEKTEATGYVVYKGDETCWLTDKRDEHEVQLDLKKTSVHCTDYDDEKVDVKGVMDHKVLVASKIAPH